MKKKQKEIFLEEEGNAWFERNHLLIKNRKMDLQDPIINTLSNILNSEDNKNLNLLEVGCGEGKRLHWIANNLKINCYGIEPSVKAVEFANNKGVNVIKGTADILDFDEKKFDFVIFGSCLYLCDRGDLFQIAKEADRVLKDSGYIIIHDFYSSTPLVREYHHYPGLFTYKMDYRKLFDWHPNYKCISHKLISESHKVINENENWTNEDRHNCYAISVLRKKFE